MIVCLCSVVGLLVGLWTFICIYMHADLSVCFFVDVCAHVCVCVCIFVYVHACV